jgi:L-ascorbate metabolism protein UlaG (beta-lactamase superfamily)
VRWTHSCVRLEAHGASLVIDPGLWSEPEALEGVDAVLLTHEHADHVDLDLVRACGRPVYAPRGAHLPGLASHPLDAGERYDVVGFEVETVGGTHARVLPDQETCANLGYVVDGVYHPGDALAVAERPVATVLVPLQASWFKTAEGVGFLRAVDARRAFGIHDGQINHRAVDAIGHWYEVGSGGRYRHLAPGTAVDLDDGDDGLGAVSGPVPESGT